MRYALIAVMVLTGVLPGCQGTPAPTTQVAVMGMERQRVSAALAEWPNIPADAPALKRPFFATIHIAGHRTTASGLLQYHNPHDFRFTAVTEMGVILFDGRMNWAGVTVLRAMPGVDRSIVETLVKDLATAFRLPSSLDGLTVRGPDVVLKRQGADTNHYTWTFDARTGRLRQTDADLGFFDTLHIEYLRYNERGWPKELTVTRKARLYTINLTFTDSVMADRGTGGQSQ